MLAITRDFATTVDNIVSSHFQDGMVEILLRHSNETLGASNPVTFPVDDLSPLARKYLSGAMAANEMDVEDLEEEPDEEPEEDEEESDEEGVPWIVYAVEQMTRLGVIAFVWSQEEGLIGRLPDGSKVAMFEA